jgi:hypothetical protein
MKDDIIRMAREAGIDWHRHWNDDESNRLEHFAALARAAEREACAKVCESRQTPGTGSVAILNGAADAIRARGDV